VTVATDLTHKGILHQRLGTATEKTIMTANG